MLFQILGLLLVCIHDVTARTSPGSGSGSQIELYVGNGCFFHEQHLITGFETSLLGRTAANITSIAAYAGGQTAPRLCYHNPGNVDDYGTLGHAEVISFTVPSDRVYHALFFYFTKAFKELLPGIWSREDVFDVGGEYRSIIGVPGGLDGPLGKVIAKANQDVHKMKLLKGHGSDPDTLKTNSVYVMDSTVHPPLQSEMCLQFHDDSPFYSPPYPTAYHSLAGHLLSRGRLHNTTCPPNDIC